MEKGLILKLFLISSLIFGSIIIFLPRYSIIKKEILIQIDPVNMPKGLVLVGSILKDIEVTILASKSKMRLLDDLKMKIPIDLSDVDIGVNSVVLKKDDLKFPRGFVIEKIYPSFVTIQIDKDEKKEFPIEVSIIGNPVSGFFVSGSTSDPLSITISGPDNIIKYIERIKTKPIDVTGSYESFKKEIAIDIPKGTKIISQTNIILAKINIVEEIITQELKNIEVKGKKSKYVYKIMPSKVDITVKGPKNGLNKLENEGNIQVFVDLIGLKPGVYVRRASIVLPVNIILIDVKPEIFTVNIEKQKL